jgi:hypothetical protein
MPGPGPRPLFRTSPPPSGSPGRFRTPRRRGRRAPTGRLSLDISRFPRRRWSELIPGSPRSCLPGDGPDLRSHLRIASMRSTASIVRVPLALFLLGVGPTPRASGQGVGCGPSDPAWKQEGGRNLAWGATVPTVPDACAGRHARWRASPGVHSPGLPIARDAWKPLDLLSVHRSFRGDSRQPAVHTSTIPDHD